MRIPKKPHPLQKIAISASLGASALMLGGKLTAYFMTHSAAILSDAVESVVHVFATGVAAASLWYASKPADENHLYGHGKIAYFSAGFEGGLILFASLGIIFSAIDNLITEQPLHNLGMGIWIISALALVNLALGIFLVYSGKKTRSLVLVSNGEHVLTDMWTSVGVVLGVGMVHLTGFIWLDAVVAILIGLQILLSGYKLVRKAWRGLLDEADPVQTKILLDCLANAVNEGMILGYHQLRHRETENIMWIEIHVILPDAISNLDAHDVATKLEQKVYGQFPDFFVQMTTHVEPKSHDLVHPHGHEDLTAPHDGVSN
jgi:cation diffusion facilitator family transporter